MADINLLPHEEKASEGVNNLHKRLTFASVAFLVLAATFTVVTLVLFTTAKAEENKQKARIESATSQINSMQTTEELLTVVDKKAKSANKVLTGRLVYTDVLNRVANLMPQNVYFGDLQINGTKMNTAAKAKTSADVAGLVSSFVSSEEGKKLFSSVTIDSLASLADPVTGQNNYSFSLTMELNSQAAAPAEVQP